MKYLNSNELFNKLFERYKGNQSGWFYNNLPDIFGCGPLIVSGNVALDILIMKTIKVIKTLREPYPLIIFDEGSDGWKDLIDNDSSPIEVSNDEELQDILQNHIWYQYPDGCNDNYSITNQNLDWFIVFCHHTDWHFYGRAEMLDKIRSVDF